METRDSSSPRPPKLATPGHGAPSDFTTVERIILVADLAGFAKAFQLHDDLAMAQFAQAYYAACARVLKPAGGTIVKFMGDACLATFAPKDAARAVAAVAALQHEVDAIAKAPGMPVTFGANLHLAEIVEGTFQGRHDILGRGVNQTFILGRGPGVRLSEPAYRALPSSARGGWRKQKPPAVYHQDIGGAGVMRGLGKSAEKNAERW